MALEPNAYGSRTTTLEAVNTLLRVIGQSRVSTLLTSNADVENCLQKLLEVNRAVQMEGWHFNTILNFTINPNSSGEIVLPENCLKVDSVDGWAGSDWVQRGTKLYDNCKHSFNIGEAVKINYVALLPFEEIPESARRWITVQAARSFGTEETNSQTTFQFTLRDEQKAEAVFKADDAANADRNLKTTSPHFKRMGRRG